VSTLVVSSFTPVLGTGRAARSYALVRALAALGPVDLLYKRFGADAPGPEFVAIDGVRLHEVRAARRVRAVARGLAGGAPLALARGACTELPETAERLAGRSVVVAEDPGAALMLSGLARRRPVVYSAQNLESAFREDWGPRRRLRAFERRLLERFAEVWMPSRADADAARALAAGAVVRVVPNVVDVSAIPAVGPTAGGPALMVADFTYRPNREALDFLLREVLPRAWQRAPRLRITVAGRGLEPPVAGDDRVRYTGFVPSLAPLYAEASCAVVPLLSGGGTPLKFIEALAYALPVVATPRAAAGLDVRAGVHYLEGADAAALAGALVAAVEGDGAAAVGAAGRALAEREYSVEALVATLAAAIDAGR
jgi:glycosyltransferase involved in cell wall biosynthesis